MNRERLWFAWYPVRVHIFDGKYIQFVRWAWLENVRVINTVWHGPLCFVYFGGPTNDP